jgi:hypothetical protein
VATHEISRSNLPTYELNVGEKKKGLFLFLFLSKREFARGYNNKLIISVTFSR